MVITVLLNEACTCAIASVTCRFAFLRTLAAAPLAGAAPCCFLSSAIRSKTLVLFGTALEAPGSDLARRRVELDRRLARALAGPGVGTRALTAHRQALAVADPPVGPEVHQPLDVHRNLAPQVALDRQPGDLRTPRRHLGLGQVLDLGLRGDPGAGTGLERLRPANAVDRRQPHPAVLVHRYVDAGYAGHL